MSSLLEGLFYEERGFASALISATGTNRDIAHATGCRLGELDLDFGEDAHWLWCRGHVSDHVADFDSLDQ